MFIRSKYLRLAAFVALSLSVITAVHGAADNLPVYTDDTLSSGWQNWSWSTDINLAATDLHAGSSGTSLSVNSSAWAALSLKADSPFTDYAGLRFDIAGAEPGIQIYFQGGTDDASTPQIPLSVINKDVTADKFTTLLIDFKSLPGTGSVLPDGPWDRINFQALGDGAAYHLDNIVLLSEIVVTPEILSAEPITNDIVAVSTKGAVNLTDITVSLSGKTITVTNRTTYTPVDSPAKSITYLSLASPFKAGNLVIKSGNSSFTHVLPAAQTGSITTSTTPISPLIYGVNFPTSANYIKDLGVTVSRWGGNAVTAYNPFGDFTNAGNDWYFENRASENGKADDWIGWVNGAGSASVLTVPALDWVAKDTTSYSYPKTIYPDQQKFDPYNTDAGNGMLTNGSYVSPVADPTRAYTPWNTTAAKTWLSGLKNKPKFVNIDNEIEIASSTHQDMHPIDIGYDEELKRIVDFATVAKQAIPSVLVAAPSSCSWWFYWTSRIGWSDTTAHNNTDFLPWFLAQMKLQEQKAKKRILDYLDIHYYFQPDTSANDDAAKALRLRMTRSLWDPTYVDESWAGSDPQNHQPNGTIIQLIPRMKSLIAQNYPGTKLSIGEWSSQNDNDLTGGLVTADVLGLFGRYGVDYATYWATPNEQGPVGLAYWLYRGYGTYFGNSLSQVRLSTPLPNTQGVFAAAEKGKTSIVIVNKNPSTPISFSLTGVPAGKYFIRHFGGAAGAAKWQTTINLKAANYIVVPPYTALFLKQN
ncbi:glycoside hydrolase family 44-domain-containing protein [Crepidotus variabilis]|uniref:Glycoside hydrolase family 44-domain-containing protein n=1 Tax=Crepidotus variabilis TaxID=179855 RepID=A0A9P6JTU7_9AGAR|nr:glycoside hydrolase family 44-domain-containing protein [Crepidotus variabilis]